MKQRKKSIISDSTRRPSRFGALEDMHPYKMMLYVGLLGSSLFFLILLIVDVIQVRSYPVGFNVVFPAIFYCSTVVMLASSITLNRVLIAFKDDRIELMKNSLGVTFLLGLFFLFFQFIGFGQLYEQGIGVEGNVVSVSLFYILSGIHIVHLVFALSIVALLYFFTLKNSKDPVKVLLLITNPYNELKYSLIATLWHYLGVIWLMVFFYFLIVLP